MKTFLMLLILFLGVFIFLKVQILGDPNSNFNQTTRYNLGQYAALRSILGLHSAGDAQKWYLKGSSPLALEVVQAKGANLDDKLVNDFAKEIQDYLGREVVVYDTETIQGGNLTDADLATIAKGSRHHVILGQPNLFVIYAEDFNRTGAEVAKTFQESAIVLSDQKLRDLTASYPQALQQYQQSTLLHEFGHQVGLEHNDHSDCIMNPAVESPQINFSFNGTYTPTQFCDFELQQLKALQGAK